MAMYLKYSIRIFEDMAFEYSNTIFQIHMWGEYCGRFTDIVALKANDSLCCLLSQQRKKNGGGGVFRTMPISC